MIRILGFIEFELYICLVSCIISSFRGALLNSLMSYCFLDIYTRRTVKVHIPSYDMEPSKHIRLEEKLSWKELGNFLHSYFKSLLETDIILFLLSFIAALTNAVSFSNALKRSKICLMFAKMYELKRIVTPGPALLCNFYVLSSFCIVFLCLWFFLKAHNNSTIYR